MPAHDVGQVPGSKRDRPGGPHNVHSSQLAHNADQHLWASSLQLPSEFTS